MTTIRDVMTPAPIAVGPDHGLKRALELLIEHRISGLPVIDAGGRILGVLSEKDLLKLFSEPSARSVGEVMTPGPVTIDVNGALVEVFDCLMANDFRRVLVEEDGKLAGVISRSDLMPTILSVLAERG